MSGDRNTSRTARDSPAVLGGTTHDTRSTAVGRRHGDRHRVVRCRLRRRRSGFWHRQHGGGLRRGAQGDPSKSEASEGTESQESDPDGSGSDGSGSDGSGSEEDPFTEECTLARPEITKLLDPPDDYAEWDVTATPNDDVEGSCEWSTSTYDTDLIVTVNAYDDWFHDESEGKPIPGLGDEPWYVTQIGTIYWRRDSYSVRSAPGL